MDREKFIEQQRRIAEEKFALASAEEDVRQSFQQLALDTYDFVVSRGGILWGFDPSWGTNAGDFTSLQKRGESTRIELSQSLLQRWEAWSRRYLEIYTGSPQLRLFDMMHAISESDNACSWPMYERRIADWVDAGDLSASPPFIDRYGIVTPEFFKELRTLRQLCGGWLYWNNDLKRVVFAPEVEWQRVRAAQEEAEAKMRRKAQEGLAKEKLYKDQLPEILDLARADKKFWEALRKWELDQEALRASRVSSLHLVSGPIRLVGGKPTDLPVDPIFKDFLAYVLQSDNVLNPGIVASCIRIELRRELGL